MRTEHSPKIAENAARTELRKAREDCAHWDYDSDGSYHECCLRVDDAKRALRDASCAVSSASL
jgi:hypothetical protein